MTEDDGRRRDEAPSDSSTDGGERETVVPENPVTFEPEVGAVRPFPRPAWVVDARSPGGPPMPAVAALPQPVDVDAMLVATRPRPVLGPALIVAGVALWSFVVMGTFTTSWLSGGGAPLSQGVAAGLMVTATMAASLFAVKRSQSVPIPGVRSPVGRFVVVGFVAFALWAAVVMVASVLGKASGANVDGLVAGGLLVTAVVAVVKGDRMLGRTRLPASSGRRALVLAAWFWVGMVTLGACVELVSEY